MVTQGGSCVVSNFPFTSYIWSTFEKTFPTHDARSTPATTEEDQGFKRYIQRLGEKAKP